MLTLRSREAVKRWQKRVGRLNVEENIKEKMVIYGVGFKSQRFFYTIGNFISYRIKTSGGSHCGRMEEYGTDWQYQRRDPHHKGAGSGDPFLAGGISVSQL